MRGATNRVDPSGALEPYDAGGIRRPSASEWQVRVRSNQATAVTQIDGKAVLVGGENNIAVFEINQSTGAPTLLQEEADKSLFWVGFVPLP